jgi:hypothetical protein
MLFPKNASGLVRLSDTVKGCLRYCARATSEILRLAGPHTAYFTRVRIIGEEALSGKISYDDADAEIQKLQSKLPPDLGLRLATLDIEQADHARTTVLMCCFCLESYINSLAYFLFKEADLLGLLRGGHQSSAEFMLEAINKMSVSQKWQTVGKLQSESGFDSSRPPYQDFRVLFLFRDDVVHDKVIDLDPNRATRYNNKLPDPVFGQCNLGHALFAAQTYWNMVIELHRLLDVEMSKFHRHYNLKPWSDDSERESLQSLARKYLENS